MSNKIINIDHSSSNGSGKIAESIKLQTTDYSPQIKYIIENLVNISDSIMDLRDPESLQRIEESLNLVAQTITESSGELFKVLSSIQKTISDLKLKFEFKNENPEIKLEMPQVSPQISIKIPPFLIGLGLVFSLYFTAILSYLVFHK